MLEIRNLSKRFGKKQVLKQINLTMENGIYGLLGANGAGKTTLIRTLAGIYPIQSGSILFEGKSIVRNHDYNCSVGYLPQKFGMFRNFTTTEMLRYFAALKEIPKAEQERCITECLQLVNLSEEANKKVSALSGGMVRRLGIAQAIMGTPKVIILDEPTVGLDPEERSRFKTMLTRLSRDRIILLSTHIVEDVEVICDQIILIDLGKITGAGTNARIRAIAEGKVYRVSVGQEVVLREPYHILKQEQWESIPCLRVLSPVPQPGDLLSPTVEDGYLCRIKGFG